MAHKICNLIKVFGKGAVIFAESCKCFKHLRSFTADLDSRRSHWLKMAFLASKFPLSFVKAICCQCYSFEEEQKCFRMPSCQDTVCRGPEIKPATLRERVWRQVKTGFSTIWPLKPLSHSKLQLQLAVPSPAWVTCFLLWLCRPFLDLSAV